MSQNNDIGGSSKEALHDAEVFPTDLSVNSGEALKSAALPQIAFGFDLLTSHYPVPEKKFIVPNATRRNPEIIQLELKESTRIPLVNL